MTAFPIDRVRAHFPALAVPGIRRNGGGAVNVWPLTRMSRGVVSACAMFSRRS